MTCKKVKLNKGAKKVVSAFRESCGCEKRDRKVAGDWSCSTSRRFHSRWNVLEIEDRAVAHIINKKRCN